MAGADRAKNLTSHLPLAESAVVRSRLGEPVKVNRRTPRKSAGSATDPAKGVSVAVVSAGRTRISRQAEASNSVMKSGMNAARSSRASQLAIAVFKSLYVLMLICRFSASASRDRGASLR